MEGIGEWWTLLILRDLFIGLSRFDDLRADLGIASNILSDRLDTLVGRGIVERRPYQEHPARSEYVLTPKGEDLFPVIAALMRWGDRWEADAAGPPALVVHAECGEVTQAVVVCSHCGLALRADNVTTMAGPGGRVGPGTALIGPVLLERSSNSPPRWGRGANVEKRSEVRPATKQRRG